MKKLIFLDVDGVLNSDILFRAAAADERWSRCSYERMRSDQLEPHLLELLVKLVKNTGAQIVVSSTWREFEIPRNILYNTLIALDLEVVDYTPWKHYQFQIQWQTPWEQLNRACEIYEVLEQRKPDRYVILDDNNIFVPETHPETTTGMERFFIQTDEETGLTAANVEKATKILNT